MLKLLITKPVSPTENTLSLGSPLLHEAVYIYTLSLGSPLLHEAVYIYICYPNINLRVGVI